MNEDKSTRFHRLRRRSAVLAAVWSVVLPAALLVSGGAVALRTAVQAHLLPAGVSPPLQAPIAAFAFAAALALAHAAGSLPFAWYTGFVLERRYDLSRQSPGQWLRDHLKALAIGLAFAGVAAAGTYAVIAASARHWWFIVAAGTILVSIAVTWLAPVVLLPLFFRAAPLGDQGLRQRLHALADRAGSPVTDVYEWRLSDRTSRANAALTGFGGTRRILLSDTMLAEYSADEIEVVLAHELSHHTRRDLWRALALEAVVVTASLWCAARLLPLALPALGIAGPVDPAGMPLLLLIVMAGSFAALPAANALSRAHERAADRFALDLTRNPDAFVSAMRRLAARNLSEEYPPAWAAIFFETHPPFTDRIAAARRWAASPGRR